MFWSGWFSDSLPLLSGVGLFLLVLVLLLVLRVLLLRGLYAWAKSTSNVVDDEIVRGLWWPSLFWVVALAGNAGLGLAPLSEPVANITNKILLSAVVLSFTIVLANAASAISGAVLNRAGQTRVTGLSRTFVRGLVFVLGLLFLLNTFGIEIAPILTALGVGGLAVALALQDTLTNFFSGLHLLLEKPFSVGHFIRLEDGQEGFVHDIGWRTTRIRTLLNHYVVIPNSKIAGSTLVNYDLPHPHMRVEVGVGVAYGSEVGLVEGALLRAVGRASAQSAVFLRDVEPEIYLVGLGEWSLNFMMRVEIRAYEDQLAAKHLLHKAILVALVEDGIEIPFPVRRVLLERL